MKIYWNPLFNFDFEKRKRLVNFACRPGMGVGMGGGWGGRGGGWQNCGQFLNVTFRNFHSYKL